MCIMNHCCYSQENTEELDENLINKLNVINYDAKKFKQITICGICLAEYTNNSKIIVLPCDRRHCFHESCIKEWLHNKNRCPTCRKPITQESLESS